MMDADSSAAAPASRASLVPQRLEQYGLMTREAMRAYLPDREGNTYLYDLLADYPTRGGKMMRSGLCLATARAFGAPLEDALPSAVAIELLHNSLLIHDDIHDESNQRRGKPTLHRLHGIPLALNAGGSLGLLSVQPLKENTERLGSRIARRIFDETERTAWESAEGQALELGWRRDNRMDVSDDEYLLMVLKKTCWLASIHPCRVGALSARAEIEADTFFRFGFFLGAAFQIQDDVLNLTSGAAYGKERAGDLWEGKRTLMLGHLYRACSRAERARLSTLFSVERAERRPEDIMWVQRSMEERGSLEHALAVARGLAGAALDEFECAFEGLPASDDKRFIAQLVRWVIERNS